METTTLEVPKSEVEETLFYAQTVLLPRTLCHFVICARPFAPSAEATPTAATQKLGIRLSSQNMGARKQRVLQLQPQF